MEVGLLWPVIWINYCSPIPAFAKLDTAVALLEWFVMFCFFTSKPTFLADSFIHLESLFILMGNFYSTQTLILKRINCEKKSICFYVTSSFTNQFFEQSNWTICRSFFISHLLLAHFWGPPWVIFVKTGLYSIGHWQSCSWVMAFAIGI